MTEKIDFKTDQEVDSATVHIGTDPKTGLELYRRFKTLNSDKHDKQHVISYEEWLIAKDGKIYEEFYRVKKYIIVDVLDNNYLGYSTWNSQLSPVLIPKITARLAALPVDVVNDYVLQNII